jgi:hypothetical protein
MPFQYIYAKGSLPVIDACINAFEHEGSCIVDEDINTAKRSSAARSIASRLLRD